MKSDIVSRLNSMYITVNEFQPLLYRERVAVGAVYQVKVLSDPYTINTVHEVKLRYLIFVPVS